jgi:hypothetical protein
MFFIHRVLNAVTMMYNEADELTACHFIRPSTYYKHSSLLSSHQEDAEASEPKNQQDTAPIVDSSDEEEKLNQS